MSNKVAKPTSYFLLWSVISLLAITSCETRENQNTAPFPEPEAPDNFLVGVWNAEWNTAQEAYEVDNPTELNMSGKIDFRNNGEVEIVAYGFEGCIFMSDTMTNQLSYRIEGDTINIHAKDDAFGLPYEIKERNPGFVKLLLMDDIWLTLTKEGKVAAK